MAPVSISRPSFLMWTNQLPAYNGGGVSTRKTQTTAARWKQYGKKDDVKNTDENCRMISSYITRVVQSICRLSPAPVANIAMLANTHHQRHPLKTLINIGIKEKQSKNTRTRLIQMISQMINVSHKQNIQ